MLPLLPLLHQPYRLLLRQLQGQAGLRRRAASGQQGSEHCSIASLHQLLQGSSKRVCAPAFGVAQWSGVPHSTA